MSEIPNIALIGAGNRGRVYTDWIAAHRDRMQVVAVAEPDEQRRESLRAIHGISVAHSFTHWEELFRPGATDEPLHGVIIATGDLDHVEPAVAALSEGLHVLLEKPMATTLEGLARIENSAAQSRGTLTICHVLRYSEVFRTIQERLQAGDIGEILSIFHAENVAYYHMAHSFVRGNWGNSNTSSPMILAKSCHDLDLLCWFTGSRPEWVASTAERSFFRRERAPEGAPERCTDGCPVADSCKYEAVMTYRDGIPLRQAIAKSGHTLAPAARVSLAAPRLAAVLPGLRRYAVWSEWPTSTITGNTTGEGIMKALREGPYGRCVYRCDNDQPDHQETIIRFASGATASFRMHGRSHEEGRTLRIDGTEGTLRAKFGAQNRIEIHRHGEVKARRISLGSGGPGHGDADMQLMEDWAGIFSGKPMPTSASESLASHRLALAAEQAARTGKAVDLDDNAAPIAPA